MAHQYLPRQLARFDTTSVADSGKGAFRTASDGGVIVVANGQNWDAGSGILKPTVNLAIYLLAVFTDDDPSTERTTVNKRVRRRYQPIDTDFGGWLLVDELTATKDWTAADIIAQLRVRWKEYRAMANNRTGLATSHSS